MLDPNFHISTQRLYISHFLPSLDTHCDFLVALRNSPEVAEANEGVSVEVPDREAARKIIEAGVPRMVEAGSGRYLVSLKPSKDDEILTENERPFSERLKDCQPIGTVSIRIRQHPKAPRVPDVGWSFLRAHWGKGYATEAAQGLFDYVEKEMGQKDLVGFCNPTNENSKKMFRRLGFEERGIRPLHGLVGGNDDAVVLGLVWVKIGMDEDLSVYNL